MIDFNDAKVQSTLLKVVKMFKPVKNGFLSFAPNEVVEGPTDRGMFGFPGYFPIPWLVEDDGFTEDEAKLFVDLVHEAQESK